jgi:hypothetical protein
MKRFKTLKNILFEFLFFIFCCITIFLGVFVGSFLFGFIFSGALNYGIHTQELVIHNIQTALFLGLISVPLVYLYNGLSGGRSR